MPANSFLSDQAWIAIYTLASLLLLLLDKKHLAEDKRAYRRGLEGFEIRGCGCLVWMTAPLLWVIVTSQHYNIAVFCMVILVIFNACTTTVAIRNRLRYYYWVERSAGRDERSKVLLEKTRGGADKEIYDSGDRPVGGFRGEREKPGSRFRRPEDRARYSGGSEG